MLTVTTIAALDDELERRRAGSRIALVPTMGALHEGHLSLVERAHLHADVVVMSIFVNPRQFGPREDFARYPRPIENDERLARECGVDILFTPGVHEIYPASPTVTVSAGAMGEQWEGEVRPGHFDGVLTVVAKLFNVVQPQVAVFGRKDLQQASLVQRMVRDLNMPLSVIVADTVREPDGLAMSSRNRFLDADGRRRSLALSRALAATVEAFAGGEESPRKLEQIGRSVLAEDRTFLPDYFAVIDCNSFLAAEAGAGGQWAAITAVRIGDIRLIDNMLLGENGAD